MAEKIIELFNSGKKMIDISKELNVSYNTVKSIVRRKTTTKEVKVKSIIEKNGDRCICCGKEITTIKGKKKRIFCSSYCKLKYWREHGKRNKK